MASNCYIVRRQDGVIALTSTCHMGAPVQLILNQEAHGFDIRCGVCDGIIAVLSAVGDRVMIDGQGQLSPNFSDPEARVTVLGDESVKN